MVLQAEGKCTSNFCTYNFEFIKLATQSSKIISLRARKLNAGHTRYICAFTDNVFNVAVTCGFFLSLFLQRVQDQMSQNSLFANRVESQFREKTELFSFFNLLLSLFFQMENGTISHISTVEQNEIQTCIH